MCVNINVEGKHRMKGDGGIKGQRAEIWLPTVVGNRYVQQGALLKRHEAFHAVVFQAGQIQGQWTT